MNYCDTCRFNSTPIDEMQCGPCRRAVRSRYPRRCVVCGMGDIPVGAMPVCSPCRNKAAARLKPLANNCGVCGQDNCGSKHEVASKSRPSWDDYFFQMAALVATRATCPRASVGVVLVKHKRVLGCGYNGNAEGVPHCPSSGTALTEHMALEHCLTAVHAECNALANSAGNVYGATAYVVGPRTVCHDCSFSMTRAGITDVRWRAS